MRQSRSENILKSEKMTVPGTLFHHNQLGSVLTMVFPKPWWEGQYPARFYLIVLIKNRLICFLGKENVFFLNRQFFRCYQLQTQWQNTNRRTFPYVGSTCWIDSKHERGLLCGWHMLCCDKNVACNPSHLENVMPCLIKLYMWLLASSLGSKVQSNSLICSTNVQWI